MGVYGDLLKYNPTGAFSFEIFTRDKVTKERTGKRIAESFLLLPPVDYSMDEEYKITVNKTIGGSWVDDFGNDNKEITLTGELYSYYFGNPERASASGGNFGIDLAKDALDDLKDIGQKVISDFTGVSGLDEFFKLRYMLSRFRDKKGGIEKDSLGSPGERQLFTFFPELRALNEEITNGREPNNENFAFVYHDYDDGNHFEVIVKKFSAKRSASDPFTVVWSIQMITLKEFSSDIRVFGKLGRGLKESAISIVENTKEGFSQSLSLIKGLTGIGDFGDALEAAKAATTIPVGLKQEFDSTIALNDSFENVLQDFIDGVRSDYSVLKADATDAQVQNDLLKAQLLATSLNISEDELKNEEKEINDEEFLKLYNSFTNLSFNLNILKGIDFYGNNAENQNVLLEEDEPSLKDTDFDSETQGGGETDKSQNKKQSVKYVYYIVDQNDTLAKIANNFYGDYTLGSIIGQVNELDNVSFDNDSLVGTTIKIPLLGAATDLQNDNNLVYSLITPDTPVIARQKQVLGSDLFFNGKEKVILADGTGDLAISVGIDAYIDSINDRMGNKQGVLGPAVPGFGLPIEVGEIPEPLKIQKLIEFVETQALSDPRTSNANVDRAKLEVIGDKIQIFLRLKPLTGSEKVLDVGKVIPGGFI